MIAAMNEAAIRVEGLTKRFGDVDALKGIDFVVPQGTVFGLLGPNGAGKTTAIRILATVLTPTSGKAEVLGYDVARQAAEVRYRIGLAGQFAAVDPNLTGRENLRLIGKLVHLPSREIGPRGAELLERFGLSDAADRPVRTYSGGMRRRLDLAAALVQRPPVLFFDEPTTGLDPQSRAQLWEMTRELVADGTTVLLTTQYMEEADRLSSQIAVINKGEVIAMDTPAALKARMGGTVIEFGLADDGTAELGAKALSRLESHSPEREREMVRLTTDEGPRVLMEALRALDSEGITPVTLTVREPSLDDVFLALTGRHAEEGDAAPTRKARGRKAGAA
ncbi:MAG: ATP-binding cassette domain-containing protein [Actinomycetota bacterium]|nr:ATP-binding cassette domain-containing protein [Actinomycetota bacterium]